jgi:acyl CoA:acetate/3-ketoacid CoA transferase alpha subunit
MNGYILTCKSEESEKLIRELIRKDKKRVTVIKENPLTVSINFNRAEKLVLRHPALQNKFKALIDDNLKDMGFKENSYEVTII